MKTASIAHDISSFGSALRRYLSVIFTLLRRENEIRRHAPLNTLMHLLEPVFLISLITSARYLIDRSHTSPLGGNPVLFYATGFIADYFFIYLSRKMGRQVQLPNHRFPIEQRLDHIVVHVVLSTIDYAFLCLVVFGFIYMFVTVDGLPFNFVPIFEACVAILMCGFGWGTINFVITRMFKPWGYVSPVFNRGLAIFSGVLFVPDFLSPGFRYVMSFNPMMHTIALFRQGFYPQYPTVVFDATYLTNWAIAFVLAGLVLERITRRAEGR